MEVFDNFFNFGINRAFCVVHCPSTQVLSCSESAWKNQAIKVGNIQSKNCRIMCCKRASGLQIKQKIKTGRNYKLNHIKSLLYSRYYGEACSEWRNPSLRLSAWATQLRRNIAAVATVCRFDQPGNRTHTYRVDNDVFDITTTARL